jgi:LysM repeat protein
MNPMSTPAMRPAHARPGLPFGLLSLLLFAALGLAGGCGQVITLTPTPTPQPTPTVGVEVAVATLPPTATPAPYTPAPTATPTVSPTPVIHTIASGESLLAIAGRYGVSVAALQDANGILDPRLLQVGQQLVIPRPEEVDEAATAALTPTPTPLPLVAENIYLNDTKIGGLWVLGEMLNPGAEALEQVRVGVTLLDENDQQLATAEGLVALDLLDPGRRAPFAVTFGESPGRFAAYRVYALHAVPAYVGSYYRDLEVHDVASEGERYASYTVTGLIRNVGPEDTVDVQVVVTAYDALNRVIAVRKVTPEYNVVPRGGETPFTAVIAPVGGPVEHLSVVAQGRRQPPPQ